MSHDPGKWKNNHDPGKWKNNDDPDGCSVAIGIIIILLIISSILD